MLFQIAAAYSLARTTGRRLALIGSLARGPRHFDPARYRSNFFARLPYLPDGTEHLPSFREASLISEPRFADTTFAPDPPASGTLILDGYFQNEAYFRAFSPAIVDLFSTTPAQLPEVLRSARTCAIHVRRGDYCAHPGIHPTIGLDYLSQAIDFMGPDRHFLVVSDDLPWCRTYLPALFGKRPHEFVNEDLPDYEALALMACCHDQIIANSTFSWWAAYLNKTPDKRVVAPRNWFTRAHAEAIAYDLDRHPIVPASWQIL